MSDRRHDTEDYARLIASKALGDKNTSYSHIDPNDPPPMPRGPVRYFDPERRPIDRVWVVLLGLVPKPFRRRWPLDGLYVQPERLAWAKREAERFRHELGWDR